MKKIIVILTCITALSWAMTVFAGIKETAEYVYKNSPSPTVSAVGGEWAVIGLKRSGADIPSDYFEKYYNNLLDYAAQRNGILHERKNTEYARVVIALTAIGKNAENAGGYNFIEPLYDYDKTVSQGINGAVWALAALPAEDNPINERYIEKILSSQKDSGGWGLSENGEENIDITAMSLTALSKYRDSDTVGDAIEKGVKFLSESQTANGGFLNGGSESSESTAQVITALCTLGISPEDERFVKNSKSAADNLMDFAVSDGGFLHEAGGKANEMATEQALIALAAAQRLKEGKNAVFDFGDTEISKSEDTSFGLPKKNPSVKRRDYIAEKSFDDIKECAEREKIEALASRGIISGKNENCFDPGSTMTRAEFASIASNALGLTAEGNGYFADVSADKWYYKPISAAYEYKIVSGVSENEFNPNGLITKEETAVMTARAAKLCGLNTDYNEEAARNTISGFIDCNNVSEWAKNALAFCYDTKILSPEDIEIDSKKPIKRAEIAAMLYNMLEAAKLL